MARHIAFLVTAAMLLAGALAASGAVWFEPDSGAKHGQALGTPTRTSTATLSRNAGHDPLPGTPLAPTTPTPEHDVMRVWWPDELYPQQDGEALEALQSQFDEFAATYIVYDLEIRRKRTTGLGGILPTLRTAGPVAPGALPDLTLMRRADMITAASEGLIEPLDEWLPADLAGTNLLPGVRALGEVSGVLYGVPYVVNLVHMAYRPAALGDPPLTFEEVLAAGRPLLFPAGATPISMTVLLQYQQAGGRLVDETGAPVLDRDALVSVLSYYANGRDAGVFQPAVLQYTRYGDYWNQFVTATNNLAVIDTATYLQNRASVPGAAPAPIATLDGEPITAIDGWLWVVTTPNPEHRQRASAFIAWMMRIGHQGLFAERFGMIPSQMRALRLWDDESYADFAQDLVLSGVIISDSQRNSTAALAIQEAVVAVLEGASPETAADAVLARFAP